MQRNDVIMAVSQTVRKANILLLSLLILHIPPLANTNPVSLSEIVSKSGKNVAGSTSTATVVMRPSPQDAQLNSLNAYATNYDHFASQFTNNAAQTSKISANISPNGNGNGNGNSNGNGNGNGNGNSNMNVNNFKPSYKLPEVENNFTPIQTYSGANSIPNDTPLTTITSPNANNIMSNNNNIPQPTPVLMQYLPHTIPENGVHYLQLIPTRPLIVPISPFLNGNGPTTTASHNTLHALHPPLAAAINGGGPLEYGAQAPAILAPETINSVANIQHQHQQPTHGPPPPPTATLIDLTNGATSPYGLHTYANAIQPYRSGYRINREVKGKHFPGTMTLNMNEYIPGPNETLRPLYMRGRP